MHHAAAARLPPCDLDHAPPSARSSLQPKRRISLAPFVIVPPFSVSACENTRASLFADVLMMRAGFDPAPRQPRSVRDLYTPGDRGLDQGHQGFPASKSNSSKGCDELFVMQSGRRM